MTSPSGGRPGPGVGQQAGAGASRPDAAVRRPPQGRHHFRPPDPADAVDTPYDGPHDRLPGPRAPRPWYLLVLGQWPIFVVLLGLASGLAVAGFGFWRRGATMIGLTMVGASLLRLLPDRVVGLLKVRSRALDVTLLAVLGIGILIMAWVISPTRK